MVLSDDSAEDNYRKIPKPGWNRIFSISSKHIKWLRKNKFPAKPDKVVVFVVSTNFNYYRTVDLHSKTKAIASILPALILAQETNRKTRLFVNFPHQSLQIEIQRFDASVLI